MIFNKGRRHHCCFLEIVCSLLIVGVQPLFSSNPVYLDQWPDPDAVVNDIMGNDDIDTLARRVGALNRMYRMTEELATPRTNGPAGRLPTADEQRVRASILKVARRLNARAPALRRDKWMARVVRYSFDDALYEQFMRRHFPREIYELHRKVMADERDHLTMLRENNDPTLRAGELAGAAALMLFVVGVFCRRGV